MTFLSALMVIPNVDRGLSVFCISGAEYHIGYCG